MGVLYKGWPKASATESPKGIQRKSYHEMLLRPRNAPTKNRFLFFLVSCLTFRMLANHPAGRSSWVPLCRSVGEADWCELQARHVACHPETFASLSEAENITVQNLQKSKGNQRKLRFSLAVLSLFYIFSLGFSLVGGRHWVYYSCDLLGWALYFYVFNFSKLFFHVFHLFFMFFLFEADLGRAFLLFILHFP